MVVVVSEAWFEPHRVHIFSFYTTFSFAASRRPPDIVGMLLRVARPCSSLLLPRFAFCVLRFAFTISFLFQAFTRKDAKVGPFHSALASSGSSRRDFPVVTT